MAASPTYRNVGSVSLNLRDSFDHVRCSIPDLYLGILNKAWLGILCLTGLMTWFHGIAGQPVFAGSIKEESAAARSAKTSSIWDRNGSMRLLLLILRYRSNWPACNDTGSLKSKIRPFSPTAQ